MQGIGYESSDGGYIASVAIFSGLSLVSFTAAVITISSDGNPIAVAAWVGTMIVSTIVSTVLTIFDGGKRKRLYDVQNTWIVSIVDAP